MQSSNALLRRTTPLLDRAVTILGWLLLPLVAFALYAVLDPRRTPGYLIGDRVNFCEVCRIFYFHVAMAWVAYLAFFIVFLGSVLYLWRRQGRWDRLARSSAEIGILFTTLVLVTGSIWARPIWGTWWTWDARLTSTLILWFIYVTYLMLRSYAGEQERAARYGAILGIVGFADVPLVHFSTRLWRGLHPGNISQVGGDLELEGSMVVILLLSLFTITLLYLYLLAQRLLLEEIRDGLRILRQEVMAGKEGARDG